jgi:hypothetical protein
MGERIGVSHMTVARASQRAGLKPHPLERYLRSDDPDFEAGGTTTHSRHTILPTIHALIAGFVELRGGA